MTGEVIPGRRHGVRAKRGPIMTGSPANDDNCAPENLEIPGSLRAPE
jgi:hypothetical protein